MYGMMVWVYFFLNFSDVFSSVPLWIDIEDQGFVQQCSGLLPIYSRAQHLVDIFI